MRALTVGMTSESLYSGGNTATLYLFSPMLSFKSSLNRFKRDGAFGELDSVILHYTYLLIHLAETCK